MTTRSRRTGGLGVALSVEWLKLRRSPVAWTAGLAVAVLVPLVSLGGYALAQNNGTSPTADKARAMVHGQGWDAVWSLGGQAISVSVLLATGIVASWCVGREFTDGTVTTLYAATVRRERIVAAKLMLVMAWAVTATTLSVTLVLVGGTALGLAPGEGFAGGARATAVGVLLALGALPTAWFASVRRGYLAGIAVALGLVTVAQLAVAAGGGAWVPWAAPVFWLGVGGPDPPGQVTNLQLAMPALLGVASGVAVVSWWHRAELGNASC